MKCLFVIGAFTVGVGCVHADRSMVYTEQGIEAAEEAWDATYHAKADMCEAQFEPKTPEMEECFGATYDADEKVGQAVHAIVALLRSYWVARAAGEQPDWATVARQVTELLHDLPPEARDYFDRVKGL